MKLVVGLGNPGAKYQQTRHNVGWEVLAELAKRYANSSPKLKFEAEILEVQVPDGNGGQEKILLLAPQTYMNESGRSVVRAVDFYQIHHNDILVVCDDLNLDSGKLRLRGSGSAGGQKGLNNIINHLGTQEIPRLRIGIGRPPGQMDAAVYVLKRFSTAERDTINDAVLRAADGIELWIRNGLDSAMNQVNAPT